MKKKKEKSSFIKFLQKCLFVMYNEKERNELPKIIFFIAGIIFIFLSTLIYLNILSKAYASFINIICVLVASCCVIFYKDRRKSSRQKKTLLSLILKIFFCLFLFFVFYLFFSRTN